MSYTADLIEHYKAVRSRMPKGKRRMHRKPETCIPESTLIQSGSHQWGPWFASDQPTAEVVRRRAELLKIMERAPKPAYPRIVPPKRIKDVVAAFYGVPLIDMLSKRRDWKTAKARHIAIYLTRLLTTLSYQQIAIQFGYPEHTAILYAIRRMDARCKANPGFAQEIDGLKQEMDATS